jgi:hypothetical protein
MPTSPRRRVHKLLGEFANLVKVAALDAGIVMSTIWPGFPHSPRQRQTKESVWKNLGENFHGGEGLRGVLFSAALSVACHSCFMCMCGMTSSCSPARKRSGIRVNFGISTTDRHFSLHRRGAR